MEGERGGRGGRGGYGGGGYVGYGGGGGGGSGGGGGGGGVGGGGGGGGGVGGRGGNGGGGGGEGRGRKRERAMGRDNNDRDVINNLVNKVIHDLDLLNVAVGRRLSRIAPVQAYVLDQVTEEVTKARRTIQTMKDRFEIILACFDEEDWD